MLDLADEGWEDDEGYDPPPLPESDGLEEDIFSDDDPAWDPAQNAGPEL